MHYTSMKYTYSSYYQVGTNMGKYITNHDAILSIVI